MYLIEKLLFPAIFFSIVATGASAETYRARSGTPLTPDQTQGHKQEPQQGTRVITNRDLGGNSQAPAARRIRVRSSDCQALMRHEPAADVAYRPEAADGRVPADLHPGTDFNERAKNVALALKVDLDDDLKTSTGQPVGAQGVIGVIEVRDGIAYLDSQPLGGDESRAIRDACVESSARRK